MKRILPVLIAVVLILAIAGGAVCMWLAEKYSYSTETVDLNTYFGVSEGECAIILQDERIEETVTLQNDVCYMKLTDIRRLLNDTFYVDEMEGLLLYTNAEGTYRAVIGGSVSEGPDGTREEPMQICYKDGGELYVALDYVKHFTNFSYEKFDKRVQMYTKWGEKLTAKINKKTQVRLKGGIKSPVLCQMEKEDEVEILEKMENWSKVKTADAIIGYVENKRLTEEQTQQEMPVQDYVEPAYANRQLGGKVCLGWHAIGGTGGNVTLDGMVAGTKGMNVIAPTWFSLNDSAGGFRSFGEASYVDRAHELGLQVWGVWDNFNYRNETGTPIDVYEVLSVTSNRTRLVNGIVDTAKSLGMDGVNLDFEELSADCGVHFVQFVRELAVACDHNQLIFSVDNYMPNEGNKYYRMDVQGEVADYVILMGYDEHWHGSKNPGSVASIGFVSDGITKTLGKVPADKLVNGLPFYMIVWTIDGAEVTDEYLTMNNLPEFLTNHPQEYTWDEATCQNYMEWTSGTQTFQVWIEDAESILVKLNVMNSNNLAGVAVWRLGYGTQAAWELINAYVSAP